VEAHIAILVEPKACHSVDTVVIFVKFVIAQFITHEEKDQDTARQTDGKAKNIDGRLGFLSLEISESRFEIVSQHDKPPVD
jgi:hypothetical protein